MAGKAYLKFTMSDVLISSYKPHADIDIDPYHVGSAWDEIPLEKFSLNFAKIEVSYQPQGADGKADGGPIIAGWDVKANKVI